MPPLAYTPTPEFWALMGLLGTALAKLGMDWIKRREERLLKEEEREAEEARRESNRKDLLLVASIAKADREAVEEKLKELNEAGANRLKTMLQSNATTRQFTKKAIDTANNTNAKIESLGQSLVDARSTPQKVEVVNTEQSPVLTEVVDHQKPVGAP
jgi:predicted sugar kinase